MRAAKLGAYEIAQAFVSERGHLNVLASRLTGIGEAPCRSAVPAAPVRVVVVLFVTKNIGGAVLERVAEISVLTRNRLVESVLLVLDDRPIGAFPDVSLLDALRNVVRRVVRADGEVGVRVGLGALYQVVLHALWADLVRRVVRASDEVVVVRHRRP